MENHLIVAIHSHYTIPLFFLGVVNGNISVGNWSSNSYSIYYKPVVNGNTNSTIE
jgi:hypothetical protein